MEKITVLDRVAGDIAAAHPSWRIMWQVPGDGGPPLDDRLDSWTSRHSTRDESLDDLERAIAYRVGISDWQAGLVERPIRSWSKLRRRKLPAPDRVIRPGYLPAQRNAQQDAALNQLPNGNRKPADFIMDLTGYPYTSAGDRSGVHRLLEVCREVLRTLQYRPRAGLAFLSDFRLRCANRSRTVLGSRYVGHAHCPARG